MRKAADHEEVSRTVHPICQSRFSMQASVRFGRGGVDHRETIRVSLVDDDEEALRVDGARGVVQAATGVGGRLAQPGATTVTKRWIPRRRIGACWRCGNPWSARLR